MTELEYYYQILGLNSRATLSVAHTAYRDLAKKWHPDKFAPYTIEQKDATKKMQAIIAAYIRQLLLRSLS